MLAFETMKGIFDYFEYNLNSKLTSYRFSAGTSINKLNWAEFNKRERDPYREMNHSRQHQCHRRCRQRQNEPSISSTSILLILSLFTAVSRAGDTDCSLRCMNGSKCVAGGAFFDDHPKEDDGSDLPFHNDNLSQDNFHCGCAGGFTGLTCGVIFENCADASELHNCYHGAPCIFTAHDDFGNQQYECDCSAVSDGDNYYTGKYCQNEHSAEVICDPSQGILCKNGGGCKVDDTNGGNFCECGDRFHGSLCELDSGVSCGDKACFNGSPCIQTDQGDAYCDCSQTSDPDRRFMGASCDKELSVACDASKTCLNAGICVSDGNG